MNPVVGLLQMNPAAAGSIIRECERAGKSQLKQRGSKTAKHNQEALECLSDASWMLIGCLWDAFLMAKRC